MLRGKKSRYVLENIQIWAQVLKNILIQVSTDLTKDTNYCKIDVESSLSA